MLKGRTVCAVVHAGDVSINYNPLNGSLKGNDFGTVAFEVGEATPVKGQSSSSLPRVRVKLLESEQVCESPLELFAEAPVPRS
jgi:hypothetical protein